MYPTSLPGTRPDLIPGSSPRTVISPYSGSRLLRMHRSNVVLPQPLAPSKPKLQDTNILTFKCTFYYEECIECTVLFLQYEASHDMLLVTP